MARTLQLNMLAELMRRLHPDVDDLWGPHLPNVRFIDRLRIAALNPQPLPPVYRRGFQMQDIVTAAVGSMFQTLNALDYQSLEQQKTTVEAMTKDIGHLAEWCGTVPINERIAALLRKKLKFGFPPPVEPVPRPNWDSVIISAAILAEAASLTTQPALAEAFDRAADQIFDQGMKMGGLG